MLHYGNALRVTIMVASPFWEHSPENRAPDPILIYSMPVNAADWSDILGHFEASIKLKSYVPQAIGLLRYIPCPDHQ